MTRIDPLIEPCPSASKSAHTLRGYCALALCVAFAACGGESSDTNPENGGSSGTISGGRASSGGTRAASGGGDTGGSSTTGGASGTGARSNDGGAEDGGSSTEGGAGAQSSDGGTETGGSSTVGGANGTGGRGISGGAGVGGMQGEGGGGQQGNAGNAGRRGDAGSGGQQGNAGNAGRRGDAGSSGRQGDAGNAGRQNNGGSAGRQGGPDECTSNADCPTIACQVTPCPEPICLMGSDGLHHCSARPHPPIDICEGGFGFCCTSDTQCSAQPRGMCIPFSFGWCGGAAPLPGNRCVYDACAQDSDCVQAANGFCAADFPRSCVYGPCRTNADCVARAGGTCSLSMVGSFCQRPAAFCRYADDPCRVNADCPRSLPFGQECVPNVNLQGTRCQNAPPPAP